MIRRDFIAKALQLLSAAGIGTSLESCTRRNSAVTILPAEDLSKDIHQDIARAISEDGLVLRGKRVLLKPNFVEFHPGRPINTDIRLIRQVAEACFRLGASEVTVGEAAGHRRDPWYSVMHPSLRQELGRKVRCLDMNHAPAVPVGNKGYYSGLPVFYLAASLMSADVVMSLPKLKTHHWVGVTLSIKNLFGALPGIVYGWPKNMLHQKGIQNSIVDLALTAPVHYAIVDGETGMEGDGPILGSPRKVGAVIMGKDLLAIDSTAARIMGFDPHRIEYMVTASRHMPGLYERGIVYRGEHPRRFAARFACLPPFEALQAGSFW